jgi:hypothetical protein
MRHVNRITLPPSNLQIIQPDGTMSASWYQFFASIAGTISQNGSALDINQIKTVAQQALVKASSEVTAVGAATAAAAAQQTADTAVTLANQAQTTAYAAYTAATNPQLLIASKNLSDIPNDPTARANLGVNLVPVTFTYGSVAASFAKYIPIVQPTTIPAGFAGTHTYCGTEATLDAVFTVRVIRASAPILIGYITLIHLGQFSSFSNQAAFKLLAGDVLQIITPPVVDASLAPCSFGA